MDLVHLGPGSKRLFSVFPSLITFLLCIIFQAVILNLISQEYRNVPNVCQLNKWFFMTVIISTRSILLVRLLSVFSERGPKDR